MYIVTAIHCIISHDDLQFLHRAICSKRNEAYIETRNAEIIVLHVPCHKHVPKPRRKKQQQQPEHGIAISCTMCYNMDCVA